MLQSSLASDIFAHSWCAALLAPLVYWLVFGPHSRYAGLGTSWFKTRLRALITSEIIGWSGTILAVLLDPNMVYVDIVVALAIQPVVVVSACLGILLRDEIRARLGQAERDEKQTYWAADQIIEHAATPDEGLDAALEYIQDVRGKVSNPIYSLESKERYLVHLKGMNMPISEIAAERLAQLDGTASDDHTSNRESDGDDHTPPTPRRGND